jgi:hypothetical protein
MVEAFSPPEALEDFFSVVESRGTFRWRTLILHQDVDGTPLEESRAFSLQDGWTWGDYYDTVRRFVVEVLYDGQPPATHRVSPTMASILSGEP